MSKPTLANMCIQWLPLLLLLTSVTARPLVRHIRSANEFDRLIEKHSTKTGLPVIVDFYSDGCGPCRMMAPIFKKLAKEMENDAVFAKVDTNQVYQLSSRYNVRSIPTFIFFYNGKKQNEFSGAGEGQLRQYAQSVIAKSQRDNIVLTKDALVKYYEEMGEKGKDVDPIIKKCADMLKSNKSGDCLGQPARELAKRLSKKYKTPPPLEPRFTDDDRHPKSDSSSQQKAKPNTSSTPDKPNLHLASKDELLKELESRLEAEQDAAMEEEDDDDAEFEHGWAPGDFPERVTIIGGGPAGIAAAIYAARAGLEPVVVAPPMGGQLQGKGVDVENYPGMVNVTGPAVIAVMRDQAVAFGTAFEAESVVTVDASQRPFRVVTNSSVIETHAIIVATGAESNWLNVTGEWEMRGGGVSSCATCDGAIYHGKHVIVVGGGDTAMEDALVLARTSQSVTLVHRRDTFRASKILAQRVIEHPKITIKYNTIVEEIVGALPPAEASDDDDDIDLDKPVQKVVTGANLYNKQTNEHYTMSCDAVFVAIGHTPATSFLKDVVAFDPDRPGYVKVLEGTTKTSVPGIFAAGDVADSMYRQAITSAGSGAMAALDAERWLSEEGLGNEKEEFEAELLRELMGDDDEKDDIGYNAYDDVTIKGVKETVAATAGSEL
eukprot:CAMPEP_0172479216 /NCGR_PEP_ID=MMETSP1066-20121228/3650_1 /TAXON_ID=671091 /ORGANISM="Coscinodiscus wailesii, Strain CCMP2513" /LENGTH=660 /DNA_ID=CAMNT_0013239473 /DNA_START=106 /DNA_END=2088 /DNA_ORIENTATION=+